VRITLHRLFLAAGISALLSLSLAGTPAAAQAGSTLRIITWADYVPADVAAQFTRETGIKVEVALSNNEEMISKLRATRGAGFDLAQPSQDRIAGPQQEFGIYKPIDLSKVRVERIQPDLLATVRRNATINGKLYALPYVWGAEGLVVNTKRTKVNDYLDLCRADLKGRTSVRLRRPTLMAFAFAMGKDPFALYGNRQAYTALMEQVGAKLIACKVNFRFFFDNRDQLLNGMRSGELHAAMMWDSGGWRLNRENPDIQFIAPKSGALGWLDTYALPARGKNEAAAYAWINFTLRPDIAARIAKSIGNFSAAKDADKLTDPVLRAQFAASFPDGFKSVRWYPAIPPGLEEIEGRILDRVKAAK
jgi:spermidine/putrescine transport system substrate-binding protein